MVSSDKLYKNNPDDIVQWVDTDRLGVFEFTFDGGKSIFNLYEDYPQKLTVEQKRIFDRENPFWADYFSGRV